MSTSPVPSQAPSAANPIARAAQLLREAAAELKNGHALRGAEYDWTSEPEAKAVHDEHLAVAAALDAFQYEKPLAEAMAAAVMPSDDEVDAVLKLCGWLSDTRHDAERRRQIRSSFRRTIHEAFKLGVEAARRSQPEPHTSMPDFWSVDVHVDAERLVSIGHNWLSGKELGQAQERAIIGAAQHLLAFVGFGLPRPDFDPDADEAAAHGAVTGELAAHQPSASSAAAGPSAELADYHGPDDTPHPVLLALSEHDNPCESTAEAIARIAALHAEIDVLRPLLLRAQAQEEAKTDRLAAEYWREQARATACVTSMADAQSDDYAAQKLAESKGYPWGTLTEHGRSLMRRLAQSASIAAAPQPDGWLPVHFRGGRFYGGPLRTEAEAKAYIQQVHQMSDSITLHARPFVFADRPPAPQQAAPELHPGTADLLECKAATVFAGPDGADSIADAARARAKEGGST